MSDDNKPMSDEAMDAHHDLMVAIDELTHMLLDGRPVPDNAQRQYQLISETLADALAAAHTTA